MVTTDPHGTTVVYALSRPDPGGESDRTEKLAEGDADRTDSGDDDDELGGDPRRWANCTLIARSTNN